jgi:integrating conjugative element membrane protein (TIGR03747 family)
MSARSLSPAVAEPRVEHLQKQVAVDQPRGLFGLAVRTIVWLWVALCLAVATEWIGMTFVWPDQGVTHSRTMLAREIDYLDATDTRSLLVSKPARYAKSFADAVYDVFVFTHVVAAMDWLAKPTTSATPAFRADLHAIYRHVAAYAVAAITIAEVFAVRLAVLTLSTPVFVLVGFVGSVDGLVQRDLRRWSGGRESSFVYHRAKLLLFSSLLVPWVLYLASPISIHPNWFILPFAAAFGLILAITAASFKKYL